MMFCFAYICYILLRHILFTMFTADIVKYIPLFCALVVAWTVFFLFKADPMFRATISIKASQANHILNFA